MDSMVFVIPIAVVALILALVLTIIGVVYFLRYQRHLDRALADPGRAGRPMASPHRVVIALCAVLAVALGSLGLSALWDALRTIPPRLESASQIVEAFAEDCTLADTCTLEVDVGTSMAAVLGYGGEGEDAGYRFAVYTNRQDPGERPWYQLRVAGSTTSVERSVRVLRFGGEMALVSLNTQGIAKIVCHNGQTMEVDPGRPFVLVMEDSGFQAYAADGSEIDLNAGGWYEDWALP